MLSIQVSQDQLEYVGLFAAPAFSLLSRPEQVVSGLYHAFSGMHHGLSDFEIESESHVPLSETIVVKLTNGGTYRFGSERIEWTLPSASTSDLDALVLDKAAEWIRSALPSGKFQSHYYTYYAHAWVLEGSAKDFLLGLGGPQLPGLGESQGTGFIFHGTYPAHGWTLQLTIDHSNVVAGGLYIHVVSTVMADHAPHQETVRYIDDVLVDSLKRLGLQLVRFAG